MKHFLKMFFVLCFIFMFSKVIFGFCKRMLNKKSKSFYFKKRTTALSMDVLSNNSLIFLQLLSTLDA